MFANFFHGAQGLVFAVRVLTFFRTDFTYFHIFVKGKLRFEYVRISNSVDYCIHFVLTSTLSRNEAGDNSSFLFDTLFF